MEKIWTCQICARPIRANNANGVIAHHGYRRPNRGSGWQTSSCRGARYLPYEKSCDQIPPTIDYIARYIESRKAFVKQYMTNPPEELSYQDYNRQWVKVQKPVGFDPVKNEQKGSFNYGSEKYESEHHHAVYNANFDIKQSTRDVEFLEKRLSMWVAPLSE